MHRTDLPAYLPQVPEGDCSNQRGHEGSAPLLVSLVTNKSILGELYLEDFLGSLQLVKNPPVMQEIPV